MQGSGTCSQLLPGFSSMTEHWSPIPEMCSLMTLSLAAFPSLSHFPSWNSTLLPETSSVSYIHSNIFFFLRVCFWRRKHKRWETRSSSRKQTLRIGPWDGSLYWWREDSDNVGPVAASQWLGLSSDLDQAECREDWLTHQHEHERAGWLLMKTMESVK